MNFRAPEGTHDVLPEEAARWRKLEDAARSCFDRFGYEEIRTPIFEYTSLFHKTSGETTDIVEKEMFTFEAWASLADELSIAMTGREFVAPIPYKLLGSNPVIQTRSDSATYDSELGVCHAVQAVKGACASPEVVSGSDLYLSLESIRSDGAKAFWSGKPESTKEEIIRILDVHLRTRLADLSLRPELTPGTIRALVEPQLFAKRNFWKVWYFGPAFRKERPQKGRFRQFTQLGVEAVGSNDPLVDAETMILFSEILKAVGVAAWELRINSIGCGECRGGYREALKAAVRPLLPTLCANCNKRVERNVFRVLDCKADAEKTQGLPAAIDHTCGKCKDHLKVVEGALKDAEVPYRIDPRIVRGLDYYTRTVYEFSSSALGAQNALAGGGRYDTLVRDMGGPDVGSVGFAAGAERILLAMAGDAAAPPPDFYAIAAGDLPRSRILATVTALRRAGLSGDMDFEGRSLKAQMRSANRSGARYALLIGPEEADRGMVKLKDMKEGAERLVSLDEAKAALQGGKK